MEYALSLVDYPTNCGDEIKATQLLLIVVCSTSGDILILNRIDMSVIVSVQGQNAQISTDEDPAVTGADIAVIEHNMGSEKILESLSGGS